MSTTSRSLVLAASLGALILATSCSNSSGSSQNVQGDIPQTLEAEGLTAMLAALGEAGLVDALRTGNLTVFAPTNAAFGELPAGWLEGLSVEELTDVLLYHVFDAGALSSSSALGRTEATMANGEEVLIDVLGSALYVNEARIVKADIQATNGLVHKLDRVLLPPVPIREALELRGEFTMLLGAFNAVGGLNLQGAGMEEMTLLAPTDAAFGQLPAGFLENLSPDKLTELLRYHMLPRRRLASALMLSELAPTLQGSSILFALPSKGPKANWVDISRLNIKATDDVVHVLDAVLMPPDHLLGTAASLSPYSTFVSLVQAAGLDAILGDHAAGPYTLFAPTNPAFAALPAGLLDDLLAEPGTPTLHRILSYHVAVGNLTSSVVKASVADGIETLEGGVLTVGQSNGRTTIDEAHVVLIDVLASNGLLHGIDAVLMPEGIVLP